MVRNLPDDGIGHGSTEFIVMRALDQADEEFIYYVSRLPEFRTFAIQQMTGTSGRQRVSWQSITDFEIADLSLAERENIGLTLSTLDDKIEQNRQMNETLEAMARTIFKDWFVDFGPTRAKAENLERYLVPELWDLFPNALDGDGKPEYWSKRPLYDIAHYVNGAAYKNMHFSLDREGLPVIKIAELKAGITANTKFTTSDLGEKYLIGTEDILFSWSGNPDTSIDTFIWDGGPAWLNQHIFRVRENGSASRAFIYFQLKLLRSTFAEIARNKQTTGLGHVTARDMKELMICNPQGAIAKAFDELATPILNRIVSNLLESRAIRGTRDLLLPKLMSGKIRLRDAEKAVEAVA